MATEVRGMVVEALVGNPGSGIGNTGMVIEALVGNPGSGIGNTGMVLEALVGNPGSGIGNTGLVLEALVSQDIPPPQPFSNLTSTNIEDSFKNIDLNRFRKVYPFLRKEKFELTFPGFSEISVEAGIVYFLTSSSETFSLQGSYTGTPAIIVTPVGNTGEAIENVNAFVSAVSGSNMTIETSEIFTGEVHFHAIEIK